MLVPDNEFEALETLLDDGVKFDAFEAYRALGDGLVFLVVVMEDRDTETAVCYPAYYDVRGGEKMLADAAAEETMYTFVRTLTEDRIRFTHDDPNVFQPPESKGRDAGETHDADTDDVADE